MLLTKMAAIDTIQAGDTVIVSTGFGRNSLELMPIVISKGGDYQSPRGFFKHDDMIGKPYGSKVSTCCCTNTERASPRAM